MITIPKPLSLLANLRHFALISPIVIPGVSSIKRLVSESCAVASFSLFQSVFNKFPVLYLYPSI